jgi:hypothetical protein
MKRAMLALSTALAMVSFFLLACNKEQPLERSIGLTDGEEVSLEKDFGGYTTRDEAPMFSDEKVMAESAEDEDASDPLSLEAATNLALATGVKAYQVRVTWGLLAGDATAKTLLDWSGRVSVSRGVMEVLKVISFEEEWQNDRLQLPRTSRTELGFTSHTDTYYDGLVLLIVDHEPGATPGEFTVQSGSYARTFTFEELASLNSIEAVGANGHEVSIISRIRGAKAFDGGFLTGRWVRKDDRCGKFYGRWINSEGANAGSLRGIWGVGRNGEQVFFGKCIGLNGEFAGRLTGRWRYESDDDDIGSFEGSWFDSEGQESGLLAGHFKIDNDDDDCGFFNGRWFTQK